MEVVLLSVVLLTGAVAVVATVAIVATRLGMAPWGHPLDPRSKKVVTVSRILAGGMDSFKLSSLLERAKK